MSHKKEALRMLDDGWMMLSSKGEHGYFTEFIPRNLADKVRKLLDQFLRLPRKEK